MQSFLFVFAFICFDGNFVSGEMSLASNEGDKQHSSVFLMMYKFMDDIFAMKNQISNLQNAVEDHVDQQEGLKNQINELKNTVGDQEEKIRQLENVNGQLESQINEKGQNKGNVLSVCQ